MKIEWKSLGRLDFEFSALKAVAEFSHDEAQLQEPDDLLFVRVALSKDKKEIFVHGHAKELNHKNELNFSFEISPTLISALAKQIDSPKIYSRLRYFSLHTLRILEQPVSI